MQKIPFNRPYLTGKELANIEQSNALGQFSGDGSFTQRCHGWLEQHAEVQKALLTHSCTAAIEMSALLLEIGPGDEVIMPSYTFVSTANAFVLRGATPVFVDIREDTLNIDESLIEAAITKNTKAIVPVHYAGVACDMQAIMSIANEYGIAVIEDAAQGIMSRYKEQPLGSIGDLGTYSFHETKNVISGEGGALLVNRESLVHRAEIIREKGTDRSQFTRGQVDKYTWQDIGSSFLPGELVAAFLSAQLEQAQTITADRLMAWERYYSLFEKMEKKELLRRPVIPKDCEHNAHMFYILLAKGVDRGQVLSSLAEDGVNAVFHYVPLHSSPAGTKFGRECGNLSHTEDLAGRLIRLPLWVGITEELQRVVYHSLEGGLKKQGFCK